MEQSPHPKLWTLNRTTKSPTEAGVKSSVDPRGVLVHHGRRCSTAFLGASQVSSKTSCFCRMSCARRTNSTNRWPVKPPCLCLVVEEGAQTGAADLYWASGVFLLCFLFYFPTDSNTNGSWSTNLTSWSTTKDNLEYRATGLRDGA